MSMPKDFMESLLEWVDDNMQRPLRIDDVARQSGYSKWYLQRRFADWAGKSLGAYIRDRKLELAAEDLKNTGDKILDISDRYGFDSQQSFTRTFGKRFNTSPAAYRRSYVEKINDYG